VKFAASFANAPLTTGQHTLQVVQVSSSTTTGNAIDATPQDGATTGNLFRYRDGQWVFNLDSKASGMARGIWQLIARLSDGTRHSVYIQLK